MKIAPSKLREDIVFQDTLQGERLVFYSTWGLFSPAEIDEGTRLLISMIDIKENYRTLDLGCGYGALGLALAKLAFRGEHHLIDKDFVAVKYAEKNIKVNNITNARVYLSNAFSDVAQNQKFDVIASNLPAKVGNELLTIMIEDAKIHLSPGGKLYVVTVAGLRKYIKRKFEEAFGNYTKLKTRKTYTVSMAEKI